MNTCFLLVLFLHFRLVGSHHGVIIVVLSCLVFDGVHIFPFIKITFDLSGLYWVMFVTIGYEWQSARQKEALRIHTRILRLTDKLESKV